MRATNIFQQYYQRWLQRRIPPQSQQILHRKNIFIFPSASGLLFLLTIFLLWLLGTNYQNNLVIMLTFLLLSLCHTSILYTYANFSGLSIEVKKVEPNFVGKTARVDFYLKNSRKKHYHTIRLGWPSSEKIEVDIYAQQTKLVSLHIPLTRRGLNQLGRLTIETTYPLGLIRSWSRLDMNVELLAYPQPIQAVFPDKKLLALSAEDHDNDDSQQEDVISMAHVADDISHLREYQEGDSPKHISWKTYAKGQGLATKVYDESVLAEQQQWLDWDDFSGFNTEARLSMLCSCLLEAEEKQLRYGLRLPNNVIPLGSGWQHQQQSLRALALFEGGKADD